MRILQVSNRKVNLPSSFKEISLNYKSHQQFKQSTSSHVLISSFKFHSTKSTAENTPHAAIPLAYLKFTSTLPEKKYDALDQPEKVVIIMHGLFGSKQNWSTLGKAFSQKLKDYTIYCLDSRNHGDSPHHEDMGYITMANDVASFLRSLPAAKSGSREINLVGHSMGGRIAMTYALASVSEPNSFPALHKLVIVDISPRKINLQSQFGLYTELMMKIDQAELTKQSDADKILKEGGVEDIGIRQFLLTNLKKLPGTTGIYRFRNPLKILNSRLNQLGESDPIFEKEIAFPCPTLFVAGSRSDYLKPNHHQELKKIFTNSDLKFLDTGHWVHAEKPKEFFELVSQFILKGSTS